MVQRVAALLLAASVSTGAAVGGGSQVELQVGEKQQAVVKASSDPACTPMREITALTFEEGGLAKRVRSSAVPTMHCMGSCLTGVQVEAAQCTAQGVDDSGQPQWKCQGRMTPGFALGKVKVQCEGCNNPGDSDVRKGSCALRYTLVRRGRGFGQGMRGTRPMMGIGARSSLYRRHYSSDRPEGAGEMGSANLLFLICGIALCVWMCSGSNRPSPQGSGPSNPAYAYGQAPVTQGYAGGSGLGGMGWGLGGLGTGMLLGSMMNSHYHQDAGYYHNTGGVYAGDIGGDLDAGGDFGGGGCGGGGDAFGGTDIV